jgi:predicted nucleotide-binding protein
LTTWRQNIEGILHAYFGPESLQLAQFRDIRFSPANSVFGQAESYFVNSFLEGVETAEKYLESRISELEEDSLSTNLLASGSQESVTMNSHKVFLVHGHDHGSKETVARFLSKLDLEPIILHEQPDMGRTVIEKFEDYSDVACAVVVLSPDDVASAKSDPSRKEERARQNVILELGFFVGRLGRDRTFALLLKGVTKPSDIDGVLYIPFEGDSWRLVLVRELKAIGLDVDANKAF